MSTYADRLNATKAHYPFDEWAESGEILEQYSEENCGRMAQIFDRLIDRLIALGERASEQDKLGAFQEAIEATNELDAENMHMLMETGERESVCDLCNHIAVAAGLDPNKYGGGEGRGAIGRQKVNRAQPGRSWFRGFQPESCGGWASVSVPTPGPRAGILVAAVESGDHLSLRKRDVRMKPASHPGWPAVAVRRSFRAESRQ